MAGSVVRRRSVGGVAPGVRQMDSKNTNLFISKLIKTDIISAEQEFNKLSVREQAEVFLKSSDNDRLSMVEISYKPRELLAEIPATEIYFTVKRLSRADALLLIKYSTPEQLQVMTDIDNWEKDRLNVASMYGWLEYISECGPEKLMEWFAECDWDQILFFFKENVVVMKKEDKDADVASDYQWPREESPITHEGVYYFQVVNEKYDQLIRYILEILAKHDLELLHKVLEGCLWEIPAESEETAFETKCRRLAEHGLPDFEEALGVYSPLPKRKFAFAPKRTRVKSELLPPRYPLVMMGDKVLFVNRVLAGLDGELEALFLKELADISNKILVAEGKDISPESMAAAIAKALTHINIGLEELSNGDINEAIRLLSEHWLLSIFQVGLHEATAQKGT